MKEALAMRIGKLILPVSGASAAMLKLQSSTKF
jgi:hypothetical protein